MSHQGGGQAGQRSVVIDSVSRPSRDVLVLSLVDPDGSALPAWEPGAHIDVILPNAPTRQYSLCGDPGDRGTYRIGVLRGTHPAGSSRQLHVVAVVGRTLEIAGPRNRFPLGDAAGYLFVAGGIGITPILPMVCEVAKRDVPWRLVYGARTKERMAFVDEISSLPGGIVELIAEDENGVLDIEALVRECPDTFAVYGCGPDGMLRALEDACRRWRPDHPPVIERFSAASTTILARASSARGAFEVELRRSGVTLTVPANRTLLSVIRDVLPDWPTSCEEGVCGTCETGVLEGVPEHHDEVLTPAERAEGATMMICVGRSATPLLVLDL